MDRSKNVTVQDMLDLARIMTKLDDTGFIKNCAEDAYQLFEPFDELVQELVYNTLYSQIFVPLKDGQVNERVIPHPEDTVVELK